MLNDFDLNIVGPALLAGMLVLSTHAPLGRRVLERGIIFIDLAIAQVAGLGVILADTFGWEAHGWEVQVVAVAAAISAAVGLNITEKLWPEIQEALIGVLFVLAASASILLLANNPHGGEHLKDLLVGQILWVDYQQLLPLAGLYALLLAFWFGLGARMPAVGFYLIFAVAITASVQLVGVYLVFSSLIIPALATRKLAPAHQLPAAWGIGLLAYVAGIGLSMVYDYPTGALIVWSMAVVAVAGAWLLPPVLGRAPAGCERQRSRTRLQG
ncbi:MAG: metal ABC transporter permease [Halioglobus sp.]